MSNQRLVILAVGVLLVMGGLVALRFPVFLGDVDQWGFQINCGSGFQSALTQAVIADSAGTHFVDRCHTALAMRRGWTIALPVTGALLVTALLIRPRRQRYSNFGWEAARQSTSLSHVRRPAAEELRRA